MTRSTLSPSSLPILRVGCAAGFSGDRTDAAAPVVQALVDSGGPAVLIFETLAERTLALAQLARRADPQAGYEPLLDELLRPVLDGGVNDALNLDSHGKCLAYLMLDLPVHVPAALWPLLAGPDEGPPPPPPPLPPDLDLLP